MSNLRPGVIVPDYHLELTDGTETYGLKFRGFQISTLSEDRFTLDFRSENKRIGEFDEQRDWTAGMAKEYLSDSPSGFFDGQNIWTLSSGHLINGLQWRFAKGLRDADFNMPGSVTWKNLIGATRFIDVKFTASANYNAAHALAWIRRVGNPGTLTVELCSDSGGSPDSVLKTMTVTVSTVTDIVSVLHDFELDSVQALTSGTDYHFKIYGSSVDAMKSCWQVACDASAAGLISADGTTWAASAYSPYYRVTDADISRKFFPFIFEGAMYLVDSKDDLTTASKLYINGIRGKATSATSTTIVDTSLTLVADRYINAYIRIVRGTGAGQTRKITDNDTNSFTVATWDKTPSTDSEFVVYSTDWFTEVGTTGLGVVTGFPAVTNGIVYFPQGETTAIRRMHLDYTVGNDHAWASEATSGSEYATLLYTFFDNNSSSVQVWRANYSSTATSVSRSTAQAWGTDLAFGTAIPLGQSNYRITNMIDHENALYVTKEDSLWSITNDRATRYNYGVQSTPDSRNGAAIITHKNFLYFSWLFSDNRLWSGTVDDVGLGWSGASLPYGREGYTSDYEVGGAWLFKSVDAGDGVSSVAVHNGIGWHELIRGFEAGRRIRSIKWQPCEETRSRLWAGIGGEMIFIEFPYKKANPLYDDETNHQHESVIISPTIDMGTGSRLPKFIKDLTVLAKNLGSGNYIGVDFQFDDDINTNTWYHAEDFNISPEQTVDFNIGNVRGFRYRLRLNTADVNTPIEVNGVAPSGFGRVPYRKVYNLYCEAGFEYTPNGNIAVSPDRLMNWLYKASEFPGRITTKSVYNLLHEKYVVVSPPQVTVTSPEFLDQNWKGNISISLMEV